MADVMGMAMRAMGVDPSTIMQQLVEQVTGALAQAGVDPATVMRELAETVQTVRTFDARLAAIQASLDMVTAEMGLYVAPPTPVQMSLIADESRRIVQLAG